MDYQSRPRVLVVDVEGNGAQPPDLVEVAATPVVAGQPVPSSARSSLIRPPGTSTLPTASSNDMDSESDARRTVAVVADNDTAITYLQ
ncbi:hypothetical protein ACWDD9_31410 [Kitasatospora sp. NPDC001119]